MGIQRKPRTGLQEVMEPQSGSKAPKKTIQANFLPFHLLNLSDLTLPITKGRGIKRVNKWWKEGRAPSLRRPSSRGELSKPGYHKP